MPDPTRPLSARSPEEVSEYIDDHLIMALNAADHLMPPRSEAENFLRNRIVAISDSWPTRHALRSEDGRRRLQRLRAAVFPEGDS